jgi:plastocyanin
MHITPSRRRPAVVVVAVLLVSALAACSGDRSRSAGGASAQLPAVAEEDWVDLTGRSEITVDTIDNAYEPRYVRVSPGTRIVFDNSGRNPHNVVPVEESAFPTVPTDELQPGDAASVTIDDEGEYPYFCSLHGTATRGMIGRIEVVGD